MPQFLKRKIEFEFLQLKNLYVDIMIDDTGWMDNFPNLARTFRQVKKIKFEWDNLMSIPKEPLDKSITVNAHDDEKQGLNIRTKLGQN